ncbi:MAG TPA: YceI family protein, partial [Gammaproteobacteria bacterium]
YPNIHVVSVNVSGSGNTLEALVRMTVRGISADIKVPIQVQRKNRTIIIKGESVISQTELGIKPFSILMGAIAVQDEMTVQFELVAMADDKQ